jgi:hypothetical protein
MRCKRYVRRGFTFCKWSIRFYFVLLCTLLPNTKDTSYLIYQYAINTNMYIDETQRPSVGGPLADITGWWYLLETGDPCRLTT